MVHIIIFARELKRPPMRLSTTDDQLPALPMRRFFSAVPEAHLLYVVPPACCRCRWFEHELFNKPGKVSFLYLDDSDIALGAFTEQIIACLERILPFLDPQPPIFQICFTCAFEVVGVDYDLLVEDLEEEFPQLQFLVFPIHHLSVHGAVMGPEGRELALYKGLRAPLPQRPTVNIVDATIACDDSNELWLALQACGIEDALQAVKMTRFAEYRALAASCLNLKIGRMGGPACRYMRDSLNIPWFELPETYSVTRLLDSLDELCAYFGTECPDFSARAEQVLAKAQRAARAFEGHPVLVSDSTSVDTIDLAAALMSYGFNVVAIDSVFPRELVNPQLEAIRSVNPDIKVYNSHLHERVQLTPEMVVLSKFRRTTADTVLFCTPTCHGEDYGLARIEHLMDIMLAFAHERL